MTTTLIKEVNSMGESRHLKVSNDSKSFTIDICEEDQKSAIKLDISETRKLCK